MDQVISERMRLTSVDMVSWFRRLITPPPDLPSSWGYFYVGSTAAYLCGLSLQPLWIAIFFSLHAPIIAAITIVMLLAFVAMIALNRRGYLQAAVCLAFAEVTTHASFLTYYIGWKASFHFFIMDLLAVWCVAPMLRLSIRVCGALLAILLVVYLNHAYAGAVPYYHIPKGWMTFFMAQSIGFAHIILGVAVYYYAVVTARIFQERELLAAQLAETRRVEGVGMLAGGVAHQFNNLLAAILGNAELVGMSVKDKRGRDLLQNIKQSCDKGKVLSSSLLTYSGYKGFDARQCHGVALLVRDGVARFEADHPDCRVELRVDDEALALTGHGAQFDQAVTALLCNAREATSTGPVRIAVTLSRVSMSHGRITGLSKNFGLCEGDAVACLEVVDHGEGIGEDMRHLVFEPFYSSRHQAGLGLSHVIGLLRMLQGGVAVDAGPDGGTRIAIYLPQ